MSEDVLRDAWGEWAKADNLTERAKSAASFWGPIAKKLLAIAEKLEAESKEAAKATDCDPHFGVSRDYSPLEGTTTIRIAGTEPCSADAATALSIRPAPVEMTQSDSKEKQP